MNVLSLYQYQSCRYLITPSNGVSTLSSVSCNHIYSYPSVLIHYPSVISQVPAHRARILSIYHIVLNRARI